MGINRPETTLGDIAQTAAVVLSILSASGVGIWQLATLNSQVKQQGEESTKVWREVKAQSKLLVDQNGRIIRLEERVYGSRP